jgi:dihydroneopterin aldolase
MIRRLQTRIAVEGIEVKAFHGVFPEEKEKGNLFSVDVYLLVEGAAAAGDDLSLTVDYAAVYRLVLEGMAEPADLLETVVYRLGDRLMADFEAILECRVRVSKYNPPGMDNCNRTYVEVSFQRGNAA